MRTPDLTPEAARELAAVDDALAGRPVDPDLADLALLATELREERPQIDGDFARSLDARRWGAEERRRRRWSWLGSSAFAPAFAASLLVALVVAGGVLSGGEDQEDMRGAGGGSVAATAEQAAPPTAAGQSARSADDDSSGAGAAADSAAPESAARLGDRRSRRKVERSATLTLAARPRDIDPIAKQVQQVTTEHGGFVRSSSISSTTDGGGGHFELRIPTRRLDAAVDALADLARVRERSQSEQDITSSFVSARERLEEAQAERRALLRALGRATTVNETASIRARLRLVADEIETAERALRRVNNRANYSTVLVTLLGDRNLGSSDPDDDGASWTPGDAIRDAGRILEVAAGVAVIAVAVLTPLALVALAGWAAGRQMRRRRRERALDAL